MAIRSKYNTLTCTSDYIDGQPGKHLLIFTQRLKCLSGVPVSQGEDAQVQPEPENSPAPPVRGPSTPRPPVSHTPAPRTLTPRRPAPRPPTQAPSLAISGRTPRQPFVAPDSSDGDEGSTDSTTSHPGGAAMQQGASHTPLAVLRDIMQKLDGFGMEDEAFEYHFVRTKCGMRTTREALADHLTKCKSCRRADNPGAAGQGPRAGPARYH